MSPFQLVGSDGPTIAETASSNRDFSVLTAIVRAAELVDTLASPGPFTVFAPTDAAFAKLPDGQVDRLLQPENRVRLASFAASHILAGRLTGAELSERVDRSDGPVTLRTVDGDTIHVKRHGDAFQVLGPKGAQAVITDLDLVQSNGVIHVTDGVISTPAC